MCSALGGGELLTWGVLQSVVPAALAALAGHPRQAGGWADGYHCFAELSTKPGADRAHHPTADA